MAALSSHRHNPTVSFESSDAEFIGKAAFVYDRPLVDGAEVMSGRFLVTGPNPQMQMHGDLPIEIAFGEELVTTQGLNEIRKSRPIYRGPTHRDGWLALSPAPEPRQLRRERFDPHPLTFELVRRNTFRHATSGGKVIHRTRQAPAREHRLFSCSGY